MWQILFCNSIARIAYREAKEHIVHARFKSHANGNRTAFWSMFKRVRQEIVDNLVQFVGIEISHVAFMLTFDREMNLLFANQRTKIRVTNVLYKSHNIIR